MQRMISPKTTKCCRSFFRLLKRNEGRECGSAGRWVKPARQHKLVTYVKVFLIQCVVH